MISVYRQRRALGLYIPRLPGLVAAMKETQAGRCILCDETLKTDYRRTRFMCTARECRNEYDRIYRAETQYRKGRKKIFRCAVCRAWIAVGLTCSDLCREERILDRQRARRRREKLYRMQRRVGGEATPLVLSSVPREIQIPSASS